MIAIASNHHENKVHPLLKIFQCGKYLKIFTTKEISFTISFVNEGNIIFKLNIFIYMKIFLMIVENISIFQCTIK